MSIMEITTTEKTGTSWLVSALSKNPNLISESLMKYTFASPDKATLEKMDTALAFHRDRIHLTSFAIEQDDIGGKGFEEGSFDLVIISNILIVQPDWERVLGKAKKLLKPNGKLCIVQMSNPGLNLVAALTFRSAHQVGERDSFESNDQALAVGLRRTKFDGDLTVMGSDTFGHQDAKLVIAVANGPVDGEVNKPCTGVDEILILEAPNSSSQMQALAIRLMQNLEKDSQFVRRVSWSMDISSLKGKFCICVAELENPILLEPGESDFAILKDLVQYCSGLLWVTSLNHPAGSLALGMARSIRNEIPGCKFRTLQLSTPLHMPDVLAPLIARCALSPTHDDELREEDGILKSCRILEDKSMTDGLAAWAVQESSAAENHRLGLAQASQKMSITTPGLLDSLCLEAEYHAKEILQDDEVEIDVKASGLK